MAVFVVVVVVVALVATTAATRAASPPRTTTATGRRRGLRGGGGATSTTTGRRDDDDDDDDDGDGAPSNEVRWEYSVDYCDAAGFASSKFESLWTKRHRRGGTNGGGGGGGGGPPRFRFADVGGVVVVVGATPAINLNGIREALERSGAAHRRRESLPSEPAPELEAKRAAK
jgi:hypothetical protein